MQCPLISVFQLGTLCVLPPVCGSTVFSAVFAACLFQPACHTNSYPPLKILSVVRLLVWGGSQVASSLIHSRLTNKCYNHVASGMMERVFCVLVATIRGTVLEMHADRRALAAHTFAAGRPASEAEQRRIVHT